MSGCGCGCGIDAMAIRIDAFYFKI